MSEFVFFLYFIYFNHITHRSESSLSVRLRDSTDDVDAAPGDVPSNWSLESEADPDESIL